jgi:hypothetical protein
LLLFSCVGLTHGSQCFNLLYFFFSSLSLFFPVKRNSVTMTAPVTVVQPQHQVLHVTCRTLHVATPVSNSPLFTIEAAPPLTCETVVMSTSTAVTVHRAAEMAAQQRAPLGVRSVGTVQIRTAWTNDANGGSTTYAVPLYQALVAYRRPNAYKERASLCIVDETPRGSAKHGRHHRWQRGQRGNTQSGAVEDKAEATRVCFVDLVFLTSMSRVLLKCTRTGELLTPVPLFCRYGGSPPQSSIPLRTGSDYPQGKSDSAEDANNNNRKAASHTHAQHHRRRVVVLPQSAAGETYELASVVMKRARDGDDAP